MKIAKKRFNPFHNLAIRYYLRKVKKIFAISCELERALHANGIKNTAVIHYGINVNEWNTSAKPTMKFRNQYGLEGKKIILFGGRISYHKGGDAILDAFSRVQKKLSNAHLLIAGVENAYAKHICLKSKTLGIDGSITITGWLNRTSMREAFLSSDVVAIPSIYFDPFNLFNIEAMAAKKPVVGTCFGGTPEITLDGETGYIVNPLDTEDFAQKLLLLLQNEKMLKEMGEKGYARLLKYFTIEGYVDQTLRYYMRG